jgi:hypothetical protein
MTPRERTEYTLIIPYAQACELIAGRVPQDVVIALISGIKAMHETPAETIESTKRRKQQQRTQTTEAA